MKLSEKHRPKTFAEVVGQEDAVRVLQEAIARGELAGGPVMIRGGPGSGKTTLAQIVGWALTGDEPGRSMEVQQFDASDISLDWIREWEFSCRTFGMSKTGRKVRILNEADQLPRLSVGRLKTTLEELPQHCTWVFTSARLPERSLFDGAAEEHEEQFISRCLRVCLRSGKQNELAFAIHLRKIAQNEGLDGRDLDSYIRLVLGENGNLRACIEAIGRGVMRKEAA